MASPNGSVLAWLELARCHSACGTSLSWSLSLLPASTVLHCIVQSLSSGLGMGNPTAPVAGWLPRPNRLGPQKSAQPTADASV